ncbi:CAAX protease self-immunity [Butyrivibrio sp. ob235]|uniref:CPBP family intramembrane glutamic endopeptidase n=1 Tax=Butyrivibrio sp. ob235 TaxID=1761780 RepID=UPI0008D474BC|nr:CPBP family intramembrane glutamic endopeptidase [Butyrivibrio sp. ob235]SEM36198.1 CAAX protease self-immunity [Butyrivibrio sp. ob235]
MNKVLDNFFVADEEYKNQLESYTIGDTLLAIAFYAIFMIVYYIVGKIYYQSGAYYVTIVNLAFILLPVVLCFRNLSKTGLSARNLKKSLIVSFILGMAVLLAISIIPGIIAHAEFLTVSQIAYYIFYFFVIIGFSEEISFRGFIQPRLFPVFKREWLTILVAGLLFVLMHYPFQMAARGMSFVEYWPEFIASAPFQLLWHYVCTWLYRRYGNIFGATVMHGCVDMSMGIFG